MIRTDLVDHTATLKHVNFRVVPVTTDEDFTCIPDGKSQPNYTGLTFSAHGPFGPWPSV